MAAPGVGAYESNGNLDAIVTSTGAIADAAVTNPASSASEIALLKGIITILAQGANAGAAGNVSAAFGGFVAGSIVDLATLLTLAGTPADANTVASLMGRLTKIRDLLNAALSVNLQLSGTAIKDDTQFGDGISSGVAAIAMRMYNGTSYDRLHGAYSITDNDPVQAGFYTIPLNRAYNGANWDRQYNNLDNTTLLASAAITGNGNSVDQTNFNARGCKIYLKTGSFGASESAMTVTIQGKDPVSNTYYTILQSASLTASSFTVLSVYPGITASANVAVSDVLPRTWRVLYAASNWGTGGSTLGVSCALIV